jgi:predicted transcriptional regulator of viral defense system
MLMESTLGRYETQFFAFTQARERQSVQTGELVRDLGWTPVQERKILSRLSKKGLVTRVRRGLYLVPPRLPPGGKWSPGEFAVLRTLVEDRGGKYQICGPNTFNRYGWTDQVPNRVFAYNNCISGKRESGGVRLILIKVGEDRLGGTELVRTPAGLEIPYSSRARSLMDAVCDWSRFNSLPQGYDWITKEIAKSDKLASELIKVCLRFGNQGTRRRVGYLLEKLGVQETLLRKLAKGVRPSASVIPWIPNATKRGTTSKRWGVAINNG